MNQHRLLSILSRLILVTLLASSFQCEAASGSVRLDNVEVEVISKQGAVLEKYEYQNEVLQMDVRGSSMVKVYFQVVGASGSSIEPDQASIIVSKLQNSGDKNIVSFASVKNGKMVGVFEWSTWENQFGAIKDGEAFEMSVALGNRSPAIAHKTSLASIIFISGPKPTQIPGKIPVIDRIARVLASLSIMPEIVHQFRPEEKMVAAPFSVVWAALVFVPVVVSVLLMIRCGANLKGYSESRASAKFVSNLFHLGILSIVVVQLAFWLRFNLMQILPVLVPLELMTLALGIKLSAISSANTVTVGSSSTDTSISKKNL